MMSGSIRQARASEPAKPDSPVSPCGITQTVKMNRPITIDGTPTITSAMNEISFASQLRPPYSSM